MENARRSLGASILAPTRWLWFVALVGVAAAGCNRSPQPEITREWKGAPYEFSIGVYTGATPTALAPPADRPSKPVFTGADVPYPPTRYVADPFVVRRDGTWYLFFELLNAITLQGDIGLATSPDGWHWQFVQTVLDEPFHLSYPFVFEWNQAWYMLPENARGGGALTLYRAVDFPLRWERDTNLLVGSYVDTTLLHYDDRWWMFTTPHHTSSLLLFMADNPRGPWTPHPASPLVTNDATISRCGGRMVVYNGTPFRFAQDDGPSYGRDVRAFRITTLTPTLYAEEPVSAEPILNATGHGWRAWGMHQVDPVELRPNQWLAIVDGVGPATPDMPLHIEFENGICLDGISVRPKRTTPGGRVLFRCFLSGVSAVPTNSLAVFAHFGPKGSETVFCDDFGLDPMRECYNPVKQIPSNAPAGWYDLHIGMYCPETGQRVALKGKQKDQYRIRKVLQVIRP